MTTNDDMRSIEELIWVYDADWSLGGVHTPRKPMLH